ncbi:flavin reductase family protein [Microbispora sp. NPDC046973]|uniref:flavin reductase family protein n=1 Tax=Microbispora sp. NPDC046973 TaxID=3155022 RepID=UPI0033C78758
MQRLASGVSIVTSCSAEGRRYGLTATAVLSLTLEPPCLVVGVNKRTRLGGILRDATGFSVSVLGTEHLDVAEAFAGKIPGVGGADRFAYGKWRDDVSGLPILEGAAACFVCAIADIMEHSTHYLLIGSVTSVHVADGEIAPLVYFSQGFTGIAGGLEAAIPSS